VTKLLFDPERRIDVEWDKGDEPGTYTVRLTLDVEDRKGILAEVSTRISGANANILDMEARTDEQQRGRIRLTVEINDMKHLEKVMKVLKSIPGVAEVDRARAVPRDPADGKER
jgi:(p)ppGpp synthase/HD superfamily hydrolase